MKRLFLTLIMAGVLMFALSSANATVTWAYHDFGTAYFDSHNNTADIAAPGYPYQPDPFQPSPGTTGLGGERFDIEGINFALDASYFYVAVTASYADSVYTAVWNRYYHEGDLFFGFDGGSKTEYAIDVSAGKLYHNPVWSGIPIVQGGYGNNPFVKGEAGAYEVNSGTLLGNVDKTYSFYLGLETNPLLPGNGNTYIKEYRFALADLGVDIASFNNVHFHETLECGNDIANKDFNIVPEPDTMILLGVGLLGMGALLRRRS